MATQVTNYQCPACTGPLNFSADSGKLECDYCGSSFEVAEVEALYAQKEAKAGTGNIGEWEGNRLMVIPQVLKAGTFELALDNDAVFVLGGDVKPIKLEWIGDTRTKEVTEGRTNNDMSMELQVQTCFGMGMMLPEAFGLFRFA